MNFQFNNNDINSAGPHQNYQILPKMSSNLLMFSCDDGSFALFNPKGNSEIIIGSKEYHIITMLDGVTTLEKISNVLGVSISDLERLLNIFIKKGLIEGYEKKRKLSLFRLVILTLPFKNGASRFNRKLCHYLTNVLFVVTFAVVFLTLVFCNFTVNTEVIRYVFTDISISHIFIYISIFLFSIFCHEMAHVMAASGFGAHVAAFRLEINNFFPGFTTVICGLATIKKKLHLLCIGLAGSMANLILFCIGVIMYNVVALEFFRKCFLALYLFNLFVALFNQILVLLKTDGLSAMSTILDVSEMSGTSLHRLFVSLRHGSISKHKKQVLIFYHTLSISFFAVMLLIFGFIL